jgi:hypothetical protein
MRVIGPEIPHFDLAGARLPFATLYFCMHRENCAGLFWQAIILVLMVIVLVDYDRSITISAVIAWLITKIYDICCCSFPHCQN